MSDRQIVISEPDARVLRSLLQARHAVPHDQEHLHDLSAELDRALVVASSQLAPSVVRLNVPVRVRDLENGRRHEWTLVSPREAAVALGRISVLAPLGTALLGYREGDVVQWDMPGGPRKFLIEAVLHRPDPGTTRVH
jgi:regulator of nucleoside diphosphate kinase